MHLKGLRRDLEEAGFQRRKDVQVVLNALGAINATLVSIDGKLTPEKPSSNQITCPYCGKRLEAPSGIVKGQHLVCPFCHEKFSY